MIKRILEDKLKKRIDYKKAIIILGPRQVGKTTLIKNLANSTGKEFVYFNGDEIETQNLWKLENINFLKLSFGNQKLILLDEAQRIENIGLICKQILDSNEGYQLIITASSSLDIANLTQEPLTGRKWEYNLFPISIGELLIHENYLEVMKNLNNHLVYGTYPEIINEQNDAREILKNLTSSYLYKDILALVGIKKPQILEKILTAIAFQVGSEVSLSELAQTVGADIKTIESYIHLLEQAFVVFRLGTFSRNLRNEINKKKKIFFYDNGIRNALISNFNPITARNDIGALWENFLIVERKKLLAYHGYYGKTYFWRNKDKAEIDYIEEINGEIYVFELKWNPKEKVKFPPIFMENYRPKEAKTINRENFMEFLTVYPY
ncbi:ATP-binding protein [Lacihabitans sp. LS3-19]|uniref:ATP-binding protein n=1 Tax=Lacihabitans sp. LS3-19 TaxID=2487335 RepID=UPI0020CF0EB4|nr:ATP-binding protein [Lacihabitans sp. LS3-19]MCP9769369.1 ATP-binding protein [Lacihabitans sp. LS3-19]